MYLTMHLGAMLPHRTVLLIEGATIPASHPTLNFLVSTDSICPHRCLAAPNIVSGLIRRQSSWDPTRRLRTVNTRIDRLACVLRHLHVPASPCPSSTTAAVYTSTMASVCKVCQDPLVIAIEPDSDDECQAVEEIQNVPDDLEMPCGCHFHW